MSRRLAALAAVIAVVAAMPGAGMASSPDDDDFVSIRLSNDEWNYEIVIRNGDGTSVRTPVGRPVIGRPALSPNGRRVVYTSPLTDDSDGRYGLFITNLQTGATRQFTTPPKGDFDPAWSPDGKRIVFSRNSEGNFNPATCCHIRVKRANGGSARRIPGTTGGTKPVWSPNGARIAYERPDGIHTTKLDGTGDRSLTGAGGSEPAWSPIGNKIAYVRPNAGAWEIAVRPATGGDWVLRVNSSQRLESPQWDPDGRTLYYLQYQGEGYDGRTNTSVWRDRSNAAPDRLFTSTRPIIHLTYSANGGAVCDFSGNQRSDLAIGIPGESVPGGPDTGAVGVIYGTGKGLRAAGDQFWHQGLTSLRGDAGNGNAFGSAVACGDFDRDGFSDLAVGIPGDTNGGGAVTIIRGATDALSGSDDQRWHADSDGIKGRRDNGDAFGSALATGDLDGDGFADLAIGVPGDNAERGSVNVLYGRGSGLSQFGDQRWTLGSKGIRGAPADGKAFGSAVAIGDFDGDGFDDLATGVPGDKAGGGSVVMIYGTGEGLAAGGNQRWHQDVDGIAGSSGPGKAFGSTVAAGDFDGDGFDDLAVGVPGGKNTGGSVSVLYGTGGGIAAAGDQLWHQNREGIAGSVAPGNAFGSALATGDFDGDGFDDLAVGVPGGKNTAGTVIVLYGTSSGLRATGSQFWHHGRESIIGELAAGNVFGSALGVADYDGDGFDDLAIGSPGDANSGGSVNVLYGTGGGLRAAGNQQWHQNSSGINDSREADDRYGAAL